MPGNVFHQIWYANFYISWTSCKIFLSQAESYCKIFWAKNKATARSFWAYEELSRKIFLSQAESYCKIFLSRPRKNLLQDLFDQNENFRKLATHKIFVAQRYRYSSLSHYKMKLLILYDSCKVWSIWHVTDDFANKNSMPSRFLQMVHLT